MKSWAYAGISMVLVGVSLSFWKWRKKDSEPISDMELKDINEVMFFSDKGLKCKMHCYKRILCDSAYCSYRNLRRLVELLESATTSLDVCHYLLTCQDLSHAIMMVHRRGVKVRIIADYDMATGSGSQIAALMKFGVPVRMKKSPYLMHHKFVVINNRVLVNGSCNWTMQGLTGNWDNIMVTSVPSLVSPFVDQFSQLWTEFTELYTSS